MEIDAITPSQLIVPTGVGGVLYSPGYFTNVDFIMN